MQKAMSNLAFQQWTGQRFRPLWFHQRKTKYDRWLPIYLLLGFKDVTPEDIAGTVAGDIAEDLQVLGIMGDVEDPTERATEKRTEDGVKVKSLIRELVFKDTLKTELTSSYGSHNAGDTLEAPATLTPWGDLHIQTSGRGQVRTPHCPQSANPCW